jgi:hypothetical protein
VRGSLVRARGALQGGRKHLFFEKKKQKTFVSITSGPVETGRQFAKVFWFFFQKTTFPK